MLISIFALLVSSAFAQAPASPASQESPIVDAASLPALQALFDAGDFEAMASQSGDATLLRRVIGLKRARAQQQSLRERYPEFHPRRDAAADRVRLLQASVVAAAGALLGAPAEPNTPAPWSPLPDPHRPNPKGEASEL